MGKRTSLFFLEQYGFSFEKLKDFIMGRNVAREKRIGLIFAFGLVIWNGQILCLIWRREKLRIRFGQGEVPLNAGA